MVSIYSHLEKGRLIKRFRAFRRIFWILSLLTAFVCRAQNYEAEFNQWFAAQTNVQSWSADFTETRSLKVLSQPLISSGKVWVRRGEFRWELGQPPQTIVVRRPDELLITYPRLKQAEIYPLENIPPSPIKDAMTLLDVTMPSDRATMERRFTLLSAAETNSTLQMTLQPKSVSARQFVSEMIVGFHTNNFTIADTEMKFADGSTLRNDFTNVVLNQPIPAKLFETNLLPNYSVVEPLKR
jgi:outer membrane lipoprotein-sorting protein